ncbi:UNVERIFIED_ORG: ureidoacrylate peracid hydrolase [Rhizobium etli]|uniref:cysteine hydrolase n=1 Tax=Rhizobium TaxID=379 RepID=UPI00098FBD34|nr:MULTISPECIES: cysteine hydrolase [Rhizobium]RSC01374.1 isochorismatase family protein [Rhizobium sophoriradicis]
MQPLVIDAKPQPISIDPAHTAVLVVDMQNDFGSMGGMFDRAGIDISGIQGAVAPTARVIAAARNLRMPVVYLKMGYYSDLSDLGTSDAPNRIRHLQVFGVGDSMTAPDGSKSRILIRDTWGTNIVDDLRPEAGDVVLYKTRFSGFYETELDSVLNNAGIKQLIVTGCTTSVCVELTIRDAFFRDYQCILLADCTSEPIASDAPRSNHDASITLVQLLFGWTSTSDHFLRAIDQRVQGRLESAAPVPESR